MSKAQRIVHACNDLADICEAIKRRAVLAEQQAKGANRQANRLGVRVSGSRGEDEPTYSNPTADEAFRALDTLEKVQTAMTDLKAYGYQVANELAEWAPNRPQDGGIRRCGADDCARPHKALGLCEAHYRAQQRAEQRRQAFEARKEAS
jgi:hypothetical protein